eukprot:gene1086-1023_t
MLKVLVYVILASCTQTLSLAREETSDTADELIPQDPAEWISKPTAGDDAAAIVSWLVGKRMGYKDKLLEMVPRNVLYSPRAIAALLASKKRSSDFITKMVNENAMQKTFELVDIEIDDKWELSLMYWQGQEMHQTCNGLSCKANKNIAVRTLCWRDIVKFLATLKTEIDKHELGGNSLSPEELNKKLSKIPSPAMMPEDDIRSTFLHELAHVKKDSKVHGPVFSDQMVFLVRKYLEERAPKIFGRTSKDKESKVETPGKKDEESQSEVDAEKTPQAKLKSKLDVVAKFFYEHAGKRKVMKGAFRVVERAMMQDVRPVSKMKVTKKKLMDLATDSHQKQTLVIQKSGGTDMLIEGRTIDRDLRITKYYVGKSDENPDGFKRFNWSDKAVNDDLKEHETLLVELARPETPPVAEAFERQDFNALMALDIYETVKVSKMLHAPSGFHFDFAFLEARRNRIPKSEIDDDFFWGVVQMVTRFYTVQYVGNSVKDSYSNLAEKYSAMGQWSLAGKFYEAAAARYPLAWRSNFLLAMENYIQCEGVEQDARMNALLKKIVRACSDRAQFHRNLIAPYIEKYQKVADSNVELTEEDLMEENLMLFTDVVKLEKDLKGKQKGRLVSHLKIAALYEAKARYWEELITLDDEHQDDEIPPSSEEKFRLPTPPEIPRGRFSIGVGNGTNHRNSDPLPVGTKKIPRRPSRSSSTRVRRRPRPTTPNESKTGDGSRAKSPEAKTHDGFIAKIKQILHRVFREESIAVGAVESGDGVYDTEQARLQKELDELIRDAHEGRLGANSPDNTTAQIPVPPSTPQVGGHCSKCSPRSKRIAMEKEHGFAGADFNESDQDDHHAEQQAAEQQAEEENIQVAKEVERIERILRQAKVGPVHGRRRGGQPLRPIIRGGVRGGRPERPAFAGRRTFRLVNPSGSPSPPTPKY